MTFSQLVVLDGCATSQPARSLAVAQVGNALLTVAAGAAMNLAA